MSLNIAPLFFASILLFDRLPAALTAAQEASSYESVRLTARVYNYAGIESYRLERTQKRVSEVLMQAGFEIHWVRCAKSESERSQYPGCIADFDPTDIIVKIMSRMDMKQNGFRNDAFGLSAGRNIMISVERMEDIAQKSEQTYDRILGLAVAHEIGHVLLGSDSHSSRGIMRPRWDAKDLQRESRHRAYFTGEQIGRMHRNQMIQNPVAGIARR